RYFAPIWLGSNTPAKSTGTSIRSDPADLLFDDPRMNSLNSFRTTVRMSSNMRVFLNERQKHVFEARFVPHHFLDLGALLHQHPYNLGNAPALSHLETQMAIVDRR